MVRKNVFMNLWIRRSLNTKLILRPSRDYLIIYLEEIRTDQWLFSSCRLNIVLIMRDQLLFNEGSDRLNMVEDVPPRSRGTRWSHVSPSKLNIIKIIWFWIYGHLSPRRHQWRTLSVWKTNVNVERFDILMIKNNSNLDASQCLGRLLSVVQTISYHYHRETV